MVKFNVYALNWNEARILPAFLHHYRQANRIIVYDNESSDNSRQIIEEAGRETVTFSTNNTFDDATNMQLKNEIWKLSRGSDVDFVIVQDLDEFLWFPNHPDDILTGLEEYKNEGITCSVTEGYDMFCSDEEWEMGLSLLEKWGIGVQFTIRKGLRNYIYDKVLVFNPNVINETNYNLGCHEWSPNGEIRFPSSQPYMLHYKYIGENYSYKNHLIRRDRFSPKNIEMNWGLQYYKDDSSMKEYLSNKYIEAKERSQEVSLPSKNIFIVGLLDTMEYLEEAMRDKRIRVWAFEPIPEIVEKIKKEYCIPDNYRIIQKAVSDVSGTAIFNVCSNPSCSSLQDWGIGPKFGDMRQITVEKITMKEFIEQNGIEEIDYLQVDTQGHDLNVLKGFGDRFSVIKHGICESMAPHTGWTLYQGQPSYQDFIDFITLMGYSSTWEYNKNCGLPNDEINITFFPK